MIFTDVIFVFCVIFIGFYFFCTYIYTDCFPRLTLLNLSFLQDQGLDIISEGLETLKELAHDMNEVCTDHSIKMILLF